LLLRTDLHTLFDLRLLTVDVATMTVMISPQLHKTCYEQLAGQQVSIPDDPKQRPSRRALMLHRRESSL
jgi:hypothetical protein